MSPSRRSSQSLIAALHPMNALHKVISRITPSDPGVCALCGLAEKNIPYAHTRSPVQRRFSDPFRNRSSITPHFSLAYLRISPCNHVFHEACLLSWLEEGLRDFVSECGRVERISCEMRERVVAAGCKNCREVEILVKTSRVDINVLEELVQRLVNKAEEDGLQTMLPTATALTARSEEDLLPTEDEQLVGDMSVPGRLSLGEQWLASRLEHKMREEELARKLQQLEVQEVKSIPTRVPLLAYMKIGKGRREKRGEKTTVDVGDECGSEM